jgi:hypothetical protein
MQVTGLRVVGNVELPWNVIDINTELVSRRVLDFNARGEDGRSPDIGCPAGLRDVNACCCVLSPEIQGGVVALNGTVGGDDAINGKSPSCR